MKVSVYFNLHKRVWSVRADEGPEKGRVVAHAKHVTLLNARGKVSAVGRAKVLQEGRKNVHAFMRGELYSLYGVDMLKQCVTDSFGPTEQWRMIGPVCLVGDYREPVRTITYNPYKYETFVHTDDESEYTSSRWAVLGSHMGPHFEFNTRTVTVKG